MYATGYDPEKLDIDALRTAFEEAAARGEVSCEDTGWSNGFNPHFLFSRGNNSNHISGINAADSAGRTRIEIAGRASLLRLYRFLKKQPGLEKLEFKLNAAECGVRETRTIVGLETVTAEEYAAGKKYKDAVSHAFYPIDLHDAKVGLDKRNLAPGIVPTVPRGALIPRNTRHLLAAGRILSSDRLANSALPGAGRMYGDPGRRRERSRRSRSGSEFPPKKFRCRNCAGCLKRIRRSFRRNRSTPARATMRQPPSPAAGSSGQSLSAGGNAAAPRSALRRPSPRSRCSRRWDAALTPQEVPRPALRKEVRLPALFPPRGLYSPEGALPNQKVRP